MRSVRRLPMFAAFAAAGFTLVAASVSHATPNPAGVFTFTIAPDGAGNVDVAGSGTINLLGDSSPGPGGGNALLHPSVANLNNGPTSGSCAIDLWSSATGPTSFGTGGSVSASSGSGTFVIFQDSAGSITMGLPSGYTSDTAISDFSAYNGTTLAGLGLTPGASYSWSWAAGTSTDTVNVNVAAVPEPASLAALGIPAAGLLLRRRRSIA